MNDWEREVWRVINGSTPVAAGQPNFSKDWHWDLYQRLNVNAEAVLHRHGVTIVDVVPMSRLRPIHGWETYDPKKPLDCLHGDPASRDWNELVVNALDNVPVDDAERALVDGIAGRGGLRHVRGAAREWCGAAPARAAQARGGHGQDQRPRSERRQQRR